MRRDVIIITERQEQLLKDYIKLKESKVYTLTISTVLKDLVNNYEPLIGTEFNGIDYDNELKILNKVDNSELTPKQLLKYFNKKYSGVNPELLKQIIRNWYSGDLDEDNLLTKNIPLTP